MLDDLTPKQQELANLMSGISERCYHAGWMGNLEYVLWYALQNGPVSYGHDTITRKDIELLRQLSAETDCWVYYDDETEETAIPVSKWQKKFNADVNEDAELLLGVSVL